jgi:hypothetical protein
MASGTLENLKRVAAQLSFDERLSLLEHLAVQLREAKTGNGASVPQAERKPQSSRGIWRDHSPPDADIDAILYEVRHEWEDELREVAEEGANRRCTTA